jgi:hypothetical protein
MIMELKYTTENIKTREDRPKMIDISISRNIDYPQFFKPKRLALIEILY